MPKQPMDYSKTIIYKICCKDINVTDVYIGHTTDFIRRKAKHKQSCNNVNSEGYNYYVYQFIRNNGGWDNFEMIEVEKHNCNDRLEACKKERYWLETLKATLNKRIPSRTKIEWYNDNKENINEKHKQYREQNKDKITEYKKEYREQNKDKINDYQKQICICNICNCNYTKGHKTHHEKTKKHQDNLNKQNNQN